MELRLEFLEVCGRFFGVVSSLRRIYDGALSPR